MAKNSTEEDAREHVIALAKRNKMYFVVWEGHFGRYLVAMRNTRGKTPNVYSVMYEAFYDFTAGDDVAFRIDLPSRFEWKDLLSIVKANLPTMKSRQEKT